MDPYPVGVLGMLLIVAGWVSSLNVIPSPRLSLLYGLGSLLLALYAYLIGDMLFLSLNTAAATIAFYNLYRGLTISGRSTARR
jgi:hypothetical protein